MSTTNITEKQHAAIDRIQGSLTDDGESVIYYDDNTQLYYLAPMEDIDYLADLMDSDDEDIAGDAYSHWCAGTSHPECDRDGELTE